jgi:nicotinate phosphoribosyltransferase
MGVFADALYPDSACKLVAYGGRPVMKPSQGNETWPGAMQVYRSPAGDVLALREEPRPRRHEPLLTAVMRASRRLGPPEPVAQARQRCEQTSATERGVTSEWADCGSAAGG